MPAPLARAAIAASSRRAFLGQLGRSGAASALRALPLFTIAAATTGTASRARAATVSTDPTTELIAMSATKIAQLIREKQISATEAVNAYIDRIQKVNPKLNAVVQMCFDRALAEAKSADAARARGELIGVLHCVPMTIKDSIDTAGVISTAGTVGRMHYVPEKDATVVARLRAAGAILLGKTNTPEWTLGGGGIPGVSTTANIVYGITRNPYDTTRSTAGSSGGAGAIVAAAGSGFDIGTDWGGSIRGPAHLNGIAGIKPTFGRVPRTGHVVDYGGIHDTWQQLGPMARRVEDLSLIMSVIAGADGYDVAIPPMPWSDPAAVDVSKLRVAIYTEAPSGEVTPETAAAVKQCAAYLEQLGCTITEDYPKELLEELNEIRTAISRESKWGLKRLAEKWGTKSISPTITGRANRESVSTAELTELLEKQDHNRSRMLSWMKNYDIVLNPVFGKPAGLIDIGPTSGDGPRSDRGANFNGTHNTTGWPAAVVRAAASPEGLPIGVQVIGQPWRDDHVLATAAYLESRTGGWQMPAI